MGAALKELAERVAAKPSVCQREAARRGLVEGVIGRCG